MVYLFVGQDPLSKDAKLKTLRQEFLSKDTEQFNLDILHARGLSLKGLQEKLSCLPANSPKRMVVVKEAQDLEDEVKDFIINFVKKPYKHLVFVLDIDEQNKKDAFLREVAKSATVFQFQEEVRPNAFTLSRQIDSRKAAYALKVLNQLLEDGERPERILGGLRYAWERAAMHPQEAKKKLKLLLNCDIEIKTGKLKPVFALEKLVVSLCSIR